MKVKCLLLAWLWCTASALAQGTFTYTFSGDNSPLNVWATVQASGQAVASGGLSEANIIGGYLLQGGSQWDIWYLNLHVDAVTGDPIRTSTRTQITGLFGYNEIDVYGGVDDPMTTVAFWPWVGSPTQYLSSGTWSMTYSVPEPGCVSLLLLGFSGFAFVRRAGWLWRKPARHRSSRHWHHA